MNEMFEQVLTLCLNHKPLNLCRALEVQKKARLQLHYVEQSIEFMRMT